MKKEFVVNIETPEGTQSFSLLYGTTVCTLLNMANSWYLYNIFGQVLPPEMPIRGTATFKTFI